MFHIRRQYRRCSKIELLLALLILLNLLIYYFLVLRPVQNDVTDNSKTAVKQYPTISSKTDGSLTIVITDFEEFDNRVAETVIRAKAAVPRANLVVVADKLPYPPLHLPDFAKLVVLTPALSGSMIAARPDVYIDSEYVVFLPDACEIISEGSLQIMLDSLSTKSDAEMVAWPATPDRDARCLALDANLKHWTLKYQRSSGLCDALSGHFVLVIRHKHLFQLPRPFQRPFNIAFFIQTALKGWKVQLVNDFTYRRIDKLFENGHYLWKHENLMLKRTQQVYKEFGVKLVQREDGSQEWYGCHKTTERCFSTVVDSMPEFLYRGRYTPPCCLKGLRKTAIHVFSILQAKGVRYWLEGGSLLGAARTGDIIEWDYDVDIGIYKEDIVKCEHLLKTDLNPYEDDQGFVWERAREGDFYRVQYSRTNRVHVDIFPFYSKNGNMTKDTWFRDHRQDMPFPEHYLKPLSTIHFIGVQVSAPNNWKDFLELKFGKGVIENPQMPKPLDIQDIR